MTTIFPIKIAIWGYTSHFQTQSYGNETWLAGKSKIMEVAAGKFIYTESQRAITMVVDYLELNMEPGKAQKTTSNESLDPEPFEDSSGSEFLIKIPAARAVFLPTNGTNIGKEEDVLKIIHPDPYVSSLPTWRPSHCSCLMIQANGSEHAARPSNSHLPPDEIDWNCSLRTVYT